ncbi:MAG TPA: TIGR03619 family F420-dependent LLM class oxidoreductase [Acidimicrobiales bacterium]|nr:TIGR03619 family F420-dependent LLM class oxidoreductase [Acidimicrobiales bacterium]
MDIGLALPQYDFSVPGEWPLRWETLAGWAERAEALGFDSVWLSDHLFLDISRYGAPPGPHACFDPLVAFAAIARRTTSVRLGTLTLCTPLRPATVLAKALATLDVVSAGRLTVGLGAGWYEAELAAAGLAPERPGVRLARLGESVQVLRGMFGGGPFSFDGRYERADGARCLPRPVQDPSPPIWVGGKGERLIELAGTYADGWNAAWIWSPEDWSERAALLDAACERAGRDPASVVRSVGLYALAGEDEADLARRFERLRQVSPPGVLDGVDLDTWRQGRLVGTVEQVGEQVRRWADLGVSSLVLNAGAVPFALASADDVSLLAEACRV